MCHCGVPRSLQEIVQKCSCIPGSNWNLKTLVFEKRGNPEYPGISFAEQRREPTTNSTQSQAKVPKSFCIRQAVGKSQSNLMIALLFTYSWKVSGIFEKRVPGAGVGPGTHWWKASALTTSPSLLPYFRIGRFFSVRKLSLHTNNYYFEIEASCIWNVNCYSALYNTNTKLKSIVELHIKDTLQIHPPRY